MRWSEPQLAMLREIGVRVWAPPSSAAPALTEASAAADGSAAEVIAARQPLASAPATAPAPESSPVPASAATPSPTSSVATLDWPELRAAVAACTTCRLCEGRRQTVFGVGHEHAHWMVVGEAPGEQEDLQGEPFVGKSGQLLDNMLRAVALTRAPGPPEQQVFIANAIKCRPPGNRNPQPDELAQCEAFLIRQVQLVQPRIILAMGRFAVHSLLRSTEPIGRLRGRVHHYQGVPLIVTYHPAYLLRNPEDKARAWDDLCLAVQTAQAGAVR